MPPINIDARCAKVRSLSFTINVRESAMRRALDLLSQYAEYHRDRRNIVTHFVGVPMEFRGRSEELDRRENHRRQRGRQGTGSSPHQTPQHTTIRHNEDASIAPTPVPTRQLD